MKPQVVTHRSLWAAASLALQNSSAEPFTSQPPSRMHQCLYTQEILARIFEEVSYRTAIENEHEDWKPPGVVACARTCKTFHEPAIKIIWRELPGISIISYLMPDSIYMFKKDMIVSCAACHLVGTS
jgi:hypothetical protein